MRKKLILMSLIFFYSCSTVSINEKYKNISDKTNEIKNISNTAKNEKTEQKSIKNINDIRVRLASLDKEKLNLILTSNMKINGQEVSSYNIELKAVDNKIMFDGNYYDNIEILNPSDTIQVGKLKYYGNFYIKANNSKLEVVNTLDMEKYLLGVLPYEIPSSFPLESLKAQAIISRTYAYKNISRFKKDFDLYDDTRSQMYQGIPQKDVKNIEKAIKSTEGLVIKYKGTLIDALFHSYSGGHTASSKEVYGNHFDYLIGVEDNYSKYVPDSVLNWKYLIPMNDIVKEVGFIVSSFDATYTESGRVDTLTLYNEDKSLSKVYKGLEFRRKFSTTNIKSTSYTLDILNNGINVIGSGYGHGVGFSQWSSKSMAQDYNMNYEEIIKFFYNGVEVVNKGD